jgi:RecB family endonuclease NucS
LSPKERFFQDMYADHPDILFPDRNYEIVKKEEWVNESTRCDIIYRDSITGGLTLVEIKRHFGSYEDISQVMRYYGELLERGIKVDNIMILAKGFTQPVEEAIKRCIIKAETLDLKRIGEIYIGPKKK